MDEERSAGRGMTRAEHVVSWIGLAAGPLLALIVPRLLPAGLTPEARATVGVACLMATWWVTEAIPVAVTALLPIILLPLLGVATIREATSPFASDLIFLFMGGFILGLAMQRCGLHRRLALLTVRLVGTRPRRMILGFMTATIVVGLWVSNTATAMMMMPIGLSVIGLVSARSGRQDAADAASTRNFATALMLTIAYGASISGVGTLIGTPPNVVLAAQIKEHLGTPLSFVGYMRIGLPVVLIMAPLVWAMLVYVIFPVRMRSIPGGRALIDEELRSLGPMSRAEWTVLCIFILTAAAWVTRPLWVDALGLYTLTAAGKREDVVQDSTIAVAAAVALFLIPVNFRQRTFAMDWRTAEGMPWGVLLLFGGGLSLAAAMTRTGVDAYLGQTVQGVEVHPALLVAGLALVLVFLSELASNTALATAVLPVLAAPATAMGVHPYLLMIPAAMACSLAFMMPVGTPPNAIVFATGHVTMRQMVKAGFWLNLIGVVVVTIIVYGAGSRLLGVDLTSPPQPPAPAAAP